MKHPPTDAMAAAFPPDFARFGRTLGPARPGAVSCPAAFAAAGQHAAAAFPSCDRAQAHAALSLWSQYYLLALVPAAVAAALATGHDLPVAAPAMSVVLAPSGLPESLCLPHGGVPASVACPVARLTPLLRGHLQPMADTLARVGLPARVLWSNAAHVLLWSLRTVSASGTAAAAHALTRPNWADGAPNPIAPVLAADGRSRRVCCLRFGVPGTARCPGCPRRT